MPSRWLRRCDAGVGRGIASGVPRCRRTFELASRSRPGGRPSTAVALGQRTIPALRRVVVAVVIRFWTETPQRQPPFVVLGRRQHPHPRVGGVLDVRVGRAPITAQPSEPPPTRSAVVRGRFRNVVARPVGGHCRSRVPRPAVVGRYRGPNPSALPAYARCHASASGVSSVISVPAHISTIRMVPSRACR